MFYVFADRFRRINFSLLLFNLFSVFFIFIPLTIILFHSFSSSSGNSWSENLAFLTPDLGLSLIRSLWVAFFTLILVFLLSYPFAYLVANISNKGTRMTLIALVTSPLWSSFFVKLIGLKSFFDLIYSDSNSTRGLIYVVIGLVYLNLPISILTFYNSIYHIPKNIVNASLDLGHNKAETIFRIIMPYTHKSMMSVVFLVFLPSITVVSVPDFMNKTNSSKLIAQIINDLVSGGGTEGLSVKRLAFLTTVMIFFIFVVCMISKACVGLYRRFCVMKYG